MDAPGKEQAAMVAALREQGCIRRSDVADAFLSVARHLFVPPAPLAAVYSADRVFPTHFDADGLPISSSSAPNIMATMLEQLDVRPDANVLEIGTGTGYNTALLAHLVGPRGRVTSVELDEEVAAPAREHLRAAETPHALVLTGDGWLGAAAHGPFDRVIVTVGAWEVSPHWFEQLRSGGILVMPLWLRPGIQVSVAFVRDADGLGSRSVHGCGFMRLRGPHAGPDALVVVPGWGDRVDGATAEREWVASIENATPGRVAQLRALLGGPVSATPAPMPAPGWTTRLALEDPDAIAFSGREAWFDFAFGLFAPDRNSLAVFDAGQIVAFGDEYCADRLRRRLPALAPLQLSRLVIRCATHPVTHPATRPATRPATAADGWLLERPHLDLIVRERPG